MNHDDAPHGDAEQPATAWDEVEDLPSGLDYLDAMGWDGFDAPSALGIHPSWDADVDVPRVLDLFADDE
jgi:hypothetical protein